MAKCGVCGKTIKSGKVLCMPCREQHHDMRTPGARLP